MSFFQILKKSKANHARVGLLHTAHGSFETPIFLPVGTLGTVKSLTPLQLKDLGAQMILGNTYHLYLRPGMEIIQAAGGLHKFMGWDQPILTDSGGFQVFSLSKLRKITEEGVEFQSHLNGDKHFFSPEKVVEIQRVLGSDIMMPLDLCSPYPASVEQLKSAVDQTTRWAQRTAEHFDKTKSLYGFEQRFFPIIQGGMNEALRQESAADLLKLGAEGYAVGGVSVGEPDEERMRMIAFSAQLIPEQKPRYLMGVGTPQDLRLAIASGFDFFDCVLPTRLARHGSAFTWEDKINIKNEKYKKDFTPLLENCDCYACLNFSKAYIRHLHLCGEILATVLMSMHNIRVLMRICDEMKEEI